MAYSKSIALGAAGSINIVESGGVATISVSLSESSGGSLANVAKATLTAQGSVSAVVLIDALLGLVAAKFPSAAALISALEAIVNAEVAQL